MGNSEIEVYSEIGTLKKVMLHRPGRELENLMPEYIERLLFDDIPYLEIARQEHDAFADILRKNGVEVVYLEDLVAESISNDDIKEQFIREYLYEAGIKGAKRTQMYIDYYKQFSTKNMIVKMIEGLRKTDIPWYGKKNLVDYLDDEYPFLIDPMPNLYFTRDPFASVGNGVTIHKMNTKTRNRETLLAKYIFKYNTLYRNTEIFYDRTEDSSLEGGDILVLNHEVVGVGISERTHPNAIEILAKKLLTSGNSFKKVLAFDIPKSRSFMHLDTVFTMVDYDKFTIHPNISEDIKLFVLEMDQNHKIKITEENDKLEEILKRHLNLEKVTLIKCGGNSIIDAAREQWNDGSNTLAIAPGKVVVYSRNYVTNEVLKEHGVETISMPSSELSRGRGGPRCMSMPLVRENLH